MQLRKYKVLFVTFIIVILGVVGCGQKRPLYLPKAAEENSASEIPDSQATPSIKKEQP
jgi:predicted small lipoprotein YifL